MGAVANLRRLASTGGVASDTNQWMVNSLLIMDDKLKIENFCEKLVENMNGFLIYNWMVYTGWCL